MRPRRGTVQFSLGMVSRTLEGSVDAEEVRRHIRTLPKRFRADAVDGLVAEWELRVGRQAYTISIGEHRCEVREGPAPGPDTIIVTEPATWIEIDRGLITGGRRSSTGGWWPRATSTSPSACRRCSGPTGAPAGPRTSTRSNSRWTG